MNAEAVLAALSTLLGKPIATQNLNAENFDGAPESHAIRSCRVDMQANAIFLKYARATELPRMQAEATGLEELQSVQVVRTPRVFAVGSSGGVAMLAMEWLDLRPSSSATDAIFGEQLARLHSTTRSKCGWSRSNYIGPTLQPNVWSDDWLHFWRTHRIEPQLDLAILKGAGGHFIERAALLNVLTDAFFTESRPLASLLHGDLWSGNYAADENNRPVMFDPAIYYGDRCADIAMTKLFGGFSAEFYAAYQAAWPLSASELARLDLYNLYHVLNHYNIFGGGYLSQAVDLVEKLLAELGH